MEYILVSALRSTKQDLHYYLPLALWPKKEEKKTDSGLWLSSSPSLLALHASEHDVCRWTLLLLLRPASIVCIMLYAALHLCGPTVCSTAR
jgi:hypothetical protein